MAEGKTTIEDIVPAPKTLAEVTADRLARYYAAYAQLHFRLSIDHPNRDKAAESAANFLSFYHITFLLRELVARGDERADEAARELWENLDHPHVPGMEVWLWLEEYGIDHERINAIAAQSIAEESPEREAGGESR